MATYKLVNADQLDSDLTAVGNAIRSKGGTSAGLSFPAGMVSAIGAISTGVELNFDVVGGTSQPRNPKENTIWVNTSKTITDWVFSATQPTAASGMVWISTGSSSTVEFNALKKNGIQVYPLSAKQYIGGAWVDKTAKSYQGGEWVDWTIYLINGSELNTEYAGAWNQTTGNQGVGGSAQMTSGGLVVTANKGNGGSGSVFRYGPDNTINFSDFNSIEFVVAIRSGSGKFSAIVTSEFATGYNSSNVAYVDTAISQENQTVSMDVSGVNGEYYLRVGTNSTATAAAYSYVIKSLRLKR